MGLACVGFENSRRALCWAFLPAAKVLGRVFGLPYTASMVAGLLLPARTRRDLPAGCAQPTRFSRCQDEDAICTRGCLCRQPGVAAAGRRLAAVPRPQSRRALQGKRTARALARQGPAP